MTKRIGRPTSDPKNTTIKIRLSDNDIEQLKFCAEKLGKTKSEVIRLGIKNIFTELKAD